MDKINKHIIRALFFACTILLLYTGCDEEQQITTAEVIKHNVPTAIVPSKDIQPPVITTLQKPDVKPLGKPIKIYKKKRAAPELLKKDFEFIQTEKIQLRPDDLNYPSTTALHSEPTLANHPKYGTNASDWKIVKNNCLHLTEKEGLWMTNNEGIHQDKEGNIWGWSKWGGAWKYDGYQFVNYYHYIGLEDYSVRNLFFDRDGDIWFGMSFGLAKFDGSHLTHYTGEGEVSKNEPTKFAEDDFGNIWVGSMDGLYCLDKKANTITHFTKENGLLDDEVSGLYRDRKGQIWISYNKLGLSLLSVEQTEAGYHYQFSNYKPSDISQLRKVHCFYSTKNGQVFIGTDRGFIQIQSTDIHSPKILKASRYYDDSRIYVLAFQEDHLGRLWLATYRYLLRLDFDKDKQIEDMSIMTVEDGLISNVVSGLAIDHENYLWVSHKDLGITKINLDQPFRSISEEYGFRAKGTEFLVDKWQNVWFLMNSDIYCLKRSRDGSEEYLQHYGRDQNVTIDNLRALTIDNDGNIWMGGRNKLKGEYEYECKLIKLELSNEGDQGIMHYYTSDIGLELLNISDLMADDQGAIWITENTLTVFNKVPTSKEGGVYKLDGDKLWYYGKEQGLMASDTELSVQDRQGNYWFSSFYYGITKFEPAGNKGLGNWIHYKFGSSYIFMNRHDSDGIWTNAQDDGRLVHLPSKVNTPSQEVEQFTVKGREWDLNNVTAFMTDVDENTWIGYINGLLKIRNKKEVLAKPNHIYDDYTKLDGIRSKYALDELVQTADSTFFVSADSQLFSFRLEDLIIEPKEKEVILHKVSLFNEEIEWGQDKEIQLKDQKIIRNFSFDNLSKWTNVPQNLSLSYQDNYIGFEYSTIEIDRPHKVEFRHFLEGYESGWNRASRDRKVTYPNLPHGEFILNISARLDNGEWGKPLKYNFEIRPPWWHSWWAYTLYIIFGVSLVYAFYQFQLNRNLEKAEAARIIELDAVKTRLYTNITHEFRTPLTVISGMTDQIEDNPKEWFNEGLSMIRRNSNRLLDLVNQMLDLNKLESGKLNLKNQQSDILVYLKYIVESIHSYAKGKNVKVHFLTEEENIIMDFDPENIRRVVMNLLSNALKFTPSEGDIYVSASRISSNGKDKRKGAMLQIKVKDTGVGIPENQLPFIFDRFYQVDDTATREGEGSGIGLALVKELIKLMKGEISVKSKLGKETVFTVLLPIHNVEKEVELPVKASKKGSTSFHSLENINTQSHLKKEDNGMLMAGAKPRILLVEDNADVVAYIASCLKDNYKIQVGTNGQEGIDIATEYIPDLIISDVMMPIKDGFEVTRTLKQDERTSHIPIIMLTAKADLDSKLEGLEKGADAYLAKPFHKEELQVRIKKLLELRINLQQHYLAVAGSSVKGNIEAPVLEDQFVIKLREVVETHLKDFDFTVEQFCKEVAMSSSQLHRKVTALTGLSPNKFIRHIRLNKAKELLQDSTATLNEVAYGTGFGDPSYFGRVFKKEFGMTPMEWKEKMMF